MEVWSWELGAGEHAHDMRLSSEATANRAFDPGGDALPRVPHIPSANVSQQTHPS
jgi:hypothetical protein